MCSQTVEKVSEAFFVLGIDKTANEFQLVKRQYKDLLQTTSKLLSICSQHAVRPAVDDIYNTPLKHIVD